MTIEYRRVAKARKKKIRLTIGIALAVLLALLAGAWLLCTVRKVEVVGNENYSAKEIEELVLSSKWDYNTIYLWYQNKYQTVSAPPFLDMVEIEIVSFHSIRIHAYEKAVVGYVEYLGNYVYFDKDGMVLETSNELKEGLPVVKGLVFDTMVLYEKLPVTDESIFKTLVSLTQMLAKNKLVPSCIEFTSDGQIDMTFGEVLVHLGKDQYMDNKIARLTGILPQLEGRSGILSMEDVDEATQRITFKKTKSKAQLEEEQRQKEEEAQNDEDSSEDWSDEDSSEDWSDEDSSGDWSDEDSSEEWSDEGSSEDWSDEDSSEDWSDEDSSGDWSDEDSSGDWSDEDSSEEDGSEE